MTWLSKVEVFVRTNPVSTVAATSAGMLVLYVVHDIRSYIALGPHGLPNTLWGWYRQLSMKPHARGDVGIPLPDDVDVDALAIRQRYPPHYNQSFLPSSSTPTYDKNLGHAFDILFPLERRLGNPPPTYRFVAPQRQVRDGTEPAMQAAMFAHLRDLARLNPMELWVENSCLEGPVPALQLNIPGIMGTGGYEPETAGAVPAMLFIPAGYRRGAVAELCHIHPVDGSTHVQLSIADSRLVIENGWGLRHRLSGGLLPWGYTFVYAPRNRAELAVWKGIVGAAVRFAMFKVAETIAW